MLSLQTHLIQFRFGYQNRNVTLQMEDMELSKSLKSLCHVQYKYFEQT